MDKMRFLLIAVLLVYVVNGLARRKCRDTRRDCKVMARMGYCIWNKDWMRKTCPAACNLCGTGVTTSAPTRGPTKNPTDKTTTNKPTVTLKPHNGDCGSPFFQYGRVIGGVTAKKGAWPWQALMKHNNKPNCGGSLISPKWVVTAAHCVSRKSARSLTVVLGDHDSSKSEGTEQTIKVSRIFAHPKWNPGTMSNDIALLQLSQPAKMNQYIRTICLPEVDAPIGQECFITGWGKIRHPGSMNKVLQQGRLNVVSNLVCEKLNFKEIPIPITNSMVCGGSGGTEKTSGCHGDSGGPFVCRKGNQWVLHGAVSHGSRDCSSRKTYTVFARVRYFRQWIKDKTGM